MAKISYKGSRMKVKDQRKSHTGRDWGGLRLLLRQLADRNDGSLVKSHPGTSERSGDSALAEGEI
jgi:hypothetical protein